MRRTFIAKLVLMVSLGAVLASCGATRPPERDVDFGTSRVPRPTITGGDEDRQLDEDDRGGQQRQAGTQYFGGTGQFVSDVGDKYKLEFDQAGDISLSFKNMDILVIARAILGDTLGLDYSVAPQVSGTASLETSGSISKEALRLSFELLLRTKGYALVETSTGLSIVPQANAVRSVGELRIERPASYSLPGFSVHVVSLKHTKPSELTKLVEPFSPPGGILRADDNRNLLILAGTSQELAGMFRAIETFDIDRMAGMSFALYSLRYVEAEQLVEELKEVYAGPDGSAEIPVHLIPVARINKIIGVAAQRSKLMEVENWINRLDIGESAPGRRIYVYNVKNGRAVDIANTLNLILDTQFGGQGLQSRRNGLNANRLRNTRNQQNGSQRGGVGNERGEGISTDQVRIVPSEENNSILIMATPAEFGTIENALRRIDVSPRQVLVEVTLAEVALTDELRYGLQWHFEFGDNEVSFGQSASPSAEFPGFSWTHNSGTNASAVLNALSSLSDVQVISAPKLLVLNNHSASLQIGDEVPVPVSSAVSSIDSNAPIVNSIQYRNTGVILTVTPRINEGGLVMMDVEQEVSTVAETSSSGIDAPTIQQRRMNTTVAVQNGSTVALGGLIRNSISRSNSGVPFLKDIPLLGEAFKNNDFVERRSELIVLLTPRIIRNTEETREAMDYLQREFRSLLGGVAEEE